MRIRKLLLITTLLILIFIFMLTSCKSSPELAVILDSNDEPRISIVNDMFDTTPDAFIKEFNKKLESKGLQLADNYYDEVSDDYIRLYRSRINENVDLIMITFEEIGDRIAWIQIKCTDKIDENYDMAEKYYQSLTECICPEFNVPGFMKIGTETFKTYDYNNLHFQYDQYNQELVSEEEQTVRFYYVTTDQANTYYRSVYEEYSNRIQELEMLL